MARGAGLELERATPRRGEGLERLYGRDAAVDAASAIVVHVKRAVGERGAQRAGVALGGHLAEQQPAKRALAMPAPPRLEVDVRHSAVRQVKPCCAVLWHGAERTSRRRRGELAALWWGGLSSLGRDEC